MLNWKEPGRHQLRMQEALSLIFRNHPELLEILFEKDRARLRADFLLRLDSVSVFSNGEQILIRVALDLWNGSGNVRMWEILESLGDDNFSGVLAGLRHLRRTDLGGAEMVWRQPKMAYSKSGVIPVPHT